MAMWGNLMETGCFFLCHQLGRKSSLSFFSEACKLRRAIYLGTI
jgi:hypothetical protein